MLQELIVVLSRTGSKVLDTPIRRSWTRTEVQTHALTEAPEPQHAHALCAGATILAATNKCLPTLDEAFFTACPRLHTIVLYATGHEHIDERLLAQHGVRLVTLPHYATRAVAEHAVGCLFSLAGRHIVANDRARSLASADVSLRGIELHGKTVGIIGLGRIGTEAASMCRALGMHVIGRDINPQAEQRANTVGITTLPLHDLLKLSDTVLVCASTLRGSGPILGATELALLHADAFIVNVGRPSRVDTAAALKALQARSLRGYAVDEIIVPDNSVDVVREGRLIQTAHSAWWRDEVLERGRTMFTEAISTALVDARHHSRQQKHPHTATPQSAPVTSTGSAA